MARTADLLINLKANISEATKQLTALERELGGVGARASKRSGGGLFSGLLGAPGKLLSGLGTLGLARQGLDSLLDAGRGVGEFLGVGLASEFEVAQAQLVAFTKDGGAAQRILTQLQSEADATPFGFQEMAQAGVMLLPISKSLGVNLMDLVRQSEILAAINPEEGLRGAAFAVREALSGDFESLQERFNLPRDTINKLKAQGLSAADVINGALASIGADQSLVTGLAKTGTGMASTFNDALASIRREAGKPILESLKTELGRFTGIVGANQDTLQASARQLGTTIGEKIRQLGEFAGTWLVMTGNIARDHNLSALDAALAALEIRVREAFGDKAGDNLHGFIAGIKGLPGAIAGLGSNFGTVTDWLTNPETGLPHALATLGQFKDDLIAGFRGMVADVKRSLGDLIIDLAEADIPFFSDKLKPAAGRLRTELYPGTIPLRGGPLPAGLPTYSQTNNFSVQLAPGTTDEQAQELARRAAAYTAQFFDQAADESSNQAPAEAPGA